MADRSGFRAPPSAPWFRHRLRHRHRPIFEPLEGRVVLSGISPANLIPISPQPVAPPSPRQLGAAYREVLAIQTTTLQSLGGSYRDVQAAAARFAGRAVAAIDGLTAEHNLHNFVMIQRDQRTFNQGGAIVAREEQGLDIARGVEDQTANTDKIYIPIGLYTTLEDLVQQSRSEGAGLARSGRRSANAVIVKLNELGDQLLRP